MKPCKKCGINKPLQDYPKTKRTIDGHTGSCKKCRNVYMTSWIARNPEKNRANKAKWKAKNPDKVRQFYDNHIARKGKSRRVLKTPEEIRIRNNEYSSKWKKQNRAKHPEKYRAIPRKLEWQRIDRLKNPEKWKAYNNKAASKLGDRYVIRLITWKSTVSSDDIPQALIEAKRLQLLIKRRVKNENSNNTTQ